MDELIWGRTKPPIEEPKLGKEAQCRLLAQARWVKTPEPMPALKAALNLAGGVCGDSLKCPNDLVGDRRKRCSHPCIQTDQVDKESLRRLSNSVSAAAHSETTRLPGRRAISSIWNANEEVLPSCSIARQIDGG